MRPSLYYEFNKYYALLTSITIIMLICECGYVVTLNKFTHPAVFNFDEIRNGLAYKLRLSLHSRKDF